MYRIDLAYKFNKGKAAQRVIGVADQRTIAEGIRQSLLAD